jgi:hypothetical protein
MRPNELPQSLLDDFDDDQRRQLGDLSGVVDALSAWQAPESTAAEQRNMVSRLTAQAAPCRPTQPVWRVWMELVFAQSRLFEPEFIYTCVGILAALLCGSLWVGLRSLPIFVVFVSPLLAVAGVLYIFHHESDALTALESVSPVGPLGLLFIRSALVLGVNLFVFLVLIITVGAFIPGISLWRLLTIWLGILTGLFGLAVYTSTRWNGLLGVVLPFGIWGALLVAVSQHAVQQAGRWSRVLDWCLVWLNASDGLLLAALAGWGLGIGFFIQAARYTRTRNPRWL